jgi:hypothetical protein
VAAWTQEHSSQDPCLRCVSFCCAGTLSDEALTSDAVKERQSALESTPTQGDPDATPKRRKALARQGSMDFLPSAPRNIGIVARFVPRLDYLFLGTRTYLAVSGITGSARSFTALNTAGLLPPLTRTPTRLASGFTAPPHCRPSPDPPPNHRPSPS